MEFFKLFSTSCALNSVQNGVTKRKYHITELASPTLLHFYGKYYFCHFNINIANAWQESGQTGIIILHNLLENISHSTLFRIFFHFRFLNSTLHAFNQLFYS